MKGAQYNATVYSGGSWSHMKVYRVFTVLQKYHTYIHMNGYRRCSD